MHSKRSRHLATQPLTTLEEADMDAVTVIIILLLAAVLAAFAYGILPYPVGWMVLLALLIARIVQRWKGSGG
jgi:hypothetical protein